MATVSAGIKVSKINFKKRELASPQKSHPSPDDFV